MLLIVVGILMTIPVVISTIKALVHKKITVDLLATIALFVSIIEGEWMSVIFINIMILCAKIFGVYTENKAKNAIKSLFKLRPTQVKIKENGEIKIIDIKDIKLNDLVIIDAGERIPVDGIIESGSAAVDQSSLTGESIPIEKKDGDIVFSSTLNMSGSLLVKVTKLGKDTTFEKLILLMETAQLGKNNIETLIEKFASRYIVITLIGAIVVYLVTKNMSIVLSLLLVTCADDIAVAVPLAFWAAIASGAKHGVIIKGGKYLEVLAKCKMLIVDKTGTLTKGKMNVNHIYTFGIEERELIKLAVTAESMSDHPMAKAIVEYAKKENIKYSIADNFEEFAGKGMKISAKQSAEQINTITVGNLNYFKSEKINISDGELKKINEAESEGHNIILVAKNNKIMGFVALGDEIKIGIRESVLKLKNMGIDSVIMLTGDNEKVAKTVSDEIGITEYKANLLPEDKLNFVKNSLNKNYKVAMVGDGVNDAAALAISDVGFAMGAIGTDSAIEAADIALMNDDFGKIAKTIGISKYVMKIVAENFVIWGVVNSIGLILVFGKFIGPTGAAAYNFISDFLPLLNSMRVMRYKY